MIMFCQLEGIMEIFDNLEALDYDADLLLWTVKLNGFFPYGVIEATSPNYIILLSQMHLNISEKKQPEHLWPTLLL